MDCVQRLKPLQIFGNGLHIGNYQNVRRDTGSGRSALPLRKEPELGDEVIRVLPREAGKPIPPLGLRTVTAGTGAQSVVRKPLNVNLRTARDE